MIQQTERETYEEIWQHEQYAAFSPGETYAKTFMEMAITLLKKEQMPASLSVLDAGCGSGKGALALYKMGFDVTLCDITSAGLVDGARALPFVESCLWEPQCESYDWVYCCDVMEHVPTAFTALVIKQLLETMIYGAFFSISLVPDQFGVLIGKPLHQTVQSFVWWRDLFNELGHVAECRDLGANGLYLVESK